MRLEATAVCFSARVKSACGKRSFSSDWNTRDTSRYPSLGSKPRRAGVLRASPSSTSRQARNSTSIQSQRSASVVSRRYSDWPDCRCLRPPSHRHRSRPDSIDRWLASPTPTGCPEAPEHQHRSEAKPLEKPADSFAVSCGYLLNEGNAVTPGQLLTAVKTDSIVGHPSRQRKSCPSTDCLTWSGISEAESQNAENAVKHWNLPHIVEKLRIGIYRRKQGLIGT
jgi:hypothetical protein